MDVQARDTFRAAREAYAHGGQPDVAQQATAQRSPSRNRNRNRRRRPGQAGRRVAAEDNSPGALHGESISVLREGLSHLDEADRHHADANRLAAEGRTEEAAQALAREQAARDRGHATVASAFRREALAFHAAGDSQRAAGSLAHADAFSRRLNRTVEPAAAGPQGHDDGNGTQGSGNGAGSQRSSGRTRARQAPQPQEVNAQAREAVELSGNAFESADEYMARADEADQAGDIDRAEHFYHQAEIGRALGFENLAHAYAAAAEEPGLSGEHAAEFRGQAADNQRKAEEIRAQDLEHHANYQEELATDLRAEANARFLFGKRGLRRQANAAAAKAEQLRGQATAHQRRADELAAQQGNGSN